MVLPTCAFFLLWHCYKSNPFVRRGPRSYQPEDLARSQSPSPSASAALRYFSNYVARGFTIRLRNYPTQLEIVRSLSFTRRCQARPCIQCWRDPGGLWLICKLPVDPVESLCQDHRLVWMLSSLLCSSFFKTAEAPQCCPAGTSMPGGPPHHNATYALVLGLPDTSRCTPSLSAGLEIADTAPDRTPVIEAKKLRSI